MDECAVNGFILNFFKRVLPLLEAGRRKNSRILIGALENHIHRSEEPFHHAENALSMQMVHWVFKALFRTSVFAKEPCFFRV